TAAAAPAAARPAPSRAAPQAAPGSPAPPPAGPAASGAAPAAPAPARPAPGTPPPGAPAPGGAAPAAAAQPAQPAAPPPPAPPARDGKGARGRAATATAQETPAAAHENTARRRGAAARTAENMAASLTVPTATSVRSIPAKLLADNRIVINNHLARGRGGKASFTHLIGYALVQALRTVPAMNHAFTLVDGKPGVIPPGHVNLGLAIDCAGGAGHLQTVP